NNMMTLQLTELNASSGVRLLVTSNITTPMIALTTTGKMLSAAVTTTPSNVNSTIQVLLVLLGVIPTSDTRIKDGSASISPNSSRLIINKITSPASSFI